jgi:hypothetical protein
VNLDEALRQIGDKLIQLYGEQHHERAQRVTHSLEALDEGSVTEVGEQKDADKCKIYIIHYKLTITHTITILSKSFKSKPS